MILFFKSSKNIHFSNRLPFFAATSETAFKQSLPGSLLSLLQPFSTGGSHMKKAKNRWLIALCAVGIHLSIGSVYAWSVFTNPLAETFGWSLSQISLTFSIAILFLGLSAAFLGHFVEKHGPKKAGMLAALFFGAGVTFSASPFRSAPFPCFICFMESSEGSDSASAILHPYLRLLNGFLTAAAWPQGLPLWASDLRL